MQQPPPSYAVKTPNPNVYTNSFSCPADKFNTEILNLFRSHVEHSPDTDPFVILNHIFDTYPNLQNLLRLQSTDIQTLTLSTNQVNDFLRKLVVLLETPTQLTNSLFFLFFIFTPLF